MLVPALFALLAAEPAATLNDWFGKIAAQQIDKREAEVRQVRTKEQAEARKVKTREALLKSLNGVPEYRGPLNAKVRGVLDGGTYRIEKLTYESLPHYVVTANLYVPKTAGKHPAVLFALGHWDQGKPFAQRIAANLARKGFVVLAFDPVGQGERRQAYSELAGHSLSGGSVEQHMLSGALNLLVGDGEMRYFVKDGMRGIDYLVSRPEVDAERIGMTGCSGGGTVTTFTSALDPRIKVAAPSCYIQTFRALVSGQTGDSEQSNPNFVALGLDQTDLVEMFAPKPWLITSTNADFFTPANAKPVYDEARVWYGLYGAEDHLKWAVGEGEHGTPQPLREAIYEWMIRWLGGGAASSKEEDVHMFADHELWVTDKGQLDAAASWELSQVIGERMRMSQSKADLKAYLRKWTSESEPDPEISIEVLPVQGTPTGRGVLVVERHYELTGRAKELAARGDTVMIVHPRGLPSAEANSNYVYGVGLPAIRASLIGRSLPLLRARDVMRAVDRLAGMAGVKEIHGEAADVAAYWLLAAAALDQRIASVRVNNAPYSIRAAFSGLLAKQLYNVAMPEFALHWDTGDLIVAISPRKVMWVDPTDWNQNIVPLKGAIYEYTRDSQ